ncbi:helix-turn-helix domain-containing protein [Actinomadura rugatobispora]|uniref:Transposase family protein n=1 Tax=Actinomadura rugatobispora TaxID=1994 RepID=A0ABW0ZXQ2_9ACTN
MADLIRKHRCRVGSWWRRLPPGRQALLVLVHLRRNKTFAGLAAAFDVGAATAHRYVIEVIELLAELAPDLQQASDPHLDIEGVPDPNTSPGSTPTHPA